MGHHTSVPGWYRMNTWSITEEPSQVCLPNKFVIRPTALYYSWCFVQKTKTAYLKASVGPEDNMQRSWFKTAVSFRNASCIDDDETYLERLCFPDEATFYAEQSTCTTVMYHMGKWQSLWCYWTWAWFTEGQCMVCFNEKWLSVLSFFEEPMVTGDTSWLWWRTLLCIISLWEQFSS